MNRRISGVAGLWLALALALAGCGGPVPAGIEGTQRRDAHIPPFARWPYQRFSREAAVAIALREWRAFGSPVAYPHRPIAGDPQRERAEGLWQRVGEYWWLGLPMGTPEQGWTGKHDVEGRVFPANEDGHYAWSAAFIDYVMRMAGAVDRFPYSPSHADYINQAREHGLGNRPYIALTAEPPQRYPPQRGDLICEWRGHQPIRYEDLPTASFFPGHCDIVVGIRRGVIDAVGGNVDNSVSMQQVPTAPDGRLSDAGGAVIDPDNPWFVVLRVGYDQ